MISPARRLPAAPILCECDRRMSRDRSRSPQHGDAIFLRETNCFFILLPIILHAADQSARGQKVCFFIEYLCFFFGRCIESTRADPSYLPICFLPMPPESSSCFGMVSDEGGGAPLSGCRWQCGGHGTYLVGTIHRYIIEYSLDKLILKEKNIILCVVVPSHIAEMVSEGSECLFSQCEKRHFGSSPATDK